MLKSSTWPQVSACCPGPAGRPGFTPTGGQIRFGYQRTSENCLIPEQDDYPVHGIDNLRVTIHRAGP